MATAPPLNVLKLAFAIHQAWSNVKAVYLFGSYAHGEQRNNSDVDLALLFAPSDAKRITLLNSLGQVQLESLLGVGVDLINLQLVDTVFQNEIIHQGKVIFWPTTLLKASWMNLK
ncbi:type VII toxin-antitoxin system MntA family adenylyltransferase antitoxin [Thiomicrorhabdus aquaedulcis]|uniref:type VII toxin-antitoxin system MntA family adenylyltransferase antitoxin n=1 Tax=Thiomicrorhabdus aquaedulcis TaxID=2211106 RepID=UPI000FD705AB|nr:nucleotidyltransferase domain-containing protein [Thiomicrorhabdus aquaedulcis]